MKGWGEEISVSKKQFLHTLRPYLENYTILLNWDLWSFCVRLGTKAKEKHKRDTPSSGARACISDPSNTSAVMDPT